MIIYIDIDDTVCSTPPALCGAPDYKRSTPTIEAITIANKAYDQGHKIVYYTARGVTVGLQEDWREFTDSQLTGWGCKYHELKMGKPYYDIFIDDKSHNSIAKLAEILDQ